MVSLSNIGNPDFGESPTRPLPATRVYKAAVNSLLEARTAVVDYLSKYGLGGGNWNGGNVYRKGKRPIAYISYNGRIWKAGQESGSREPYEPIVCLNAAMTHLTINYLFIGS